MYLIVKNAQNLSRDPDMTPLYSSGSDSRKRKNRRHSRHDRRKSVREGVIVSLSFSGERRRHRDRRMRRDRREK